MARKISQTITLEDFAMPRQQIAQLDHHIRVSSGRLNVGYLPASVCGMRMIFAPPFAAHDYELRFDFIDYHSRSMFHDYEERYLCDSRRKVERVGGFPDAADLRVLVRDIEWHPHKLVRLGACHAETKLGLVSFRIRSELIPLAQEHAFILKLEVANLLDKQLRLGLRPQHVPFHLAKVPSHLWNWVEPTPAVRAIFKPSQNLFKGKNACLAFAVSPGRLRNGCWQINIPACEIRNLYFVVAIAEKKSDACALAQRLAVSAQRQITTTTKRWRNRLKVVSDRIPQLETSHTPLQKFYERSLMTFLYSRWESPSLLFRSHYASAGVDGTGLSSYVWDASYISKMMPLLDPVGWKAMIRQWLLIDLHEYNQFSSINGEGLGGWYAYNDYAITRLIYDYLCITQDFTFLNETCGRTTVLGALKNWLLDTDKRRPQRDFLLDYGSNAQLLELRSSGYEGIVPCPNAERYWCYLRVAELCERIGDSDSAMFRANAERVRASFLKHLWNKSMGWCWTMDKTGRKECIFTVQIFYLLFTGILSRHQSTSLIQHLNEEEFISRWGLHSLSKQDIRYEMHDVDWGGAGTYIGTTPDIVQALYQNGFDKHGWNILSRLLWWGEAFPYYPQVVRADKPSYEEIQRANCIGGGAAAEAILFGMCGLRYGLDGRLQILPTLPKEVKYLRLKNCRIGERTFEIVMEPHGYRVLGNMGVKGLQRLGHRLNLT